VCRAAPIELTTGGRAAHAVRCIRADELSGGPVDTREQVA
jgi:hypothetical protein